MDETTTARAAAGKPGRYHHGNLRASLLQAAELELGEKGIEGVSLRGIAKRAGVSHAAPAHHFGDLRGLFTALATVGFERFVKTQKARQAQAASDPASQLAALGLGYIDFALANPALFRLMFSSDRPNFADPALCSAADTALTLLAENVRRIKSAEPGLDRSAMIDVSAAWAMAHGLADLLNSGRLKHLLGLPKAERELTVSKLLLRSLAERI